MLPIESTENQVLTLHALEASKSECIDSELRSTHTKKRMVDPELNSEHAAFWSTFNAGVYYVVPDGKLGRLNIPSELLEKVGITKEVVFAGVGYKIELWSKERREAFLMSDDQFKETAARLSAKK